jgi:aminoglycoside phosphotransferase (APT) family kinase protein
MEEQHARERAYLLRLWREGEDMPWRASLLVTETGARRAFGSLESLFAFLRALTRADAADAEEEHA